MKIAAEFQAALPEPQTILGLRLLPLSIGRYSLLKRFDCPFVSDEERTESVKELTKELFFALIICGLPVSEFKELLMEPKKLQKEARRFGKVAGKLIDRQPDFSILVCFEQFKRFLSSATKTPWHVMPRESDNDESASHWCHSIEVILRSKVGWTQHEVDEEPLSKGLADFFKFLESEGHVDLISHEDYEIFRKTGDENARILASLN